MTKQKEVVCLVLVLIIQVVLYLPQVGHGFIKDDFIWIDNAVTEGKVDWEKPWLQHSGFFRPLVGASFALQYWLHGLNPLPYGLFNLALHLIILLLIYLLLRAWPPSAPYAFAVTSLTSLNAKGVQMAVGWISGRTTLLFAVFLLAALLVHLQLFRKERSNKRLSWMGYPLVSLFYFCSLLSKEEAMAAPLFVFLFLPFLDRDRWGNRFKGIRFRLLTLFPYLIPLAFYSILRFQSGAYLPTNAPDYYRFSFAPGLILKNLAEYILRAGLLDLYLLVISTILFLVFGRIFQRRDDAQPVFWVGFLFFLSMQTTTIFLPARSDIYVYVSQLGVHLLAAHLLFRLFARFSTWSPYRKRIVAMIMGIFLCAWLAYLQQRISVYRMEADCSSRFSGELANSLRNSPSPAFIRIIDRSTETVRSPLSCVSYGFNALLALQFPEKAYSGEISSQEPPAEIVPQAEIPVLLFFWEDSHLRTPNNYSNR